jgi:adenylate kinase family enzyme
MKLKNRKAILITGPAGSGKTSLAERIAQNENWIHVSEDLHWVEIKKGHPVGESRTPEEQRTVQPAVVLQIRDLLAKGNRVVLEFINYENPPKPLLYYSEELAKVQCHILVKVLRPSDKVIMARKKIRGRANDQDYEQGLKNARHQLACLESSYIADEWMIDNSEMTVEEVYAQWFLAFVEENA